MILLDSLKLGNDVDAGTDLMLSTTDKNDMDNFDNPDTEASQIKADYNDAWSGYRELSEDLKHSWAGDAPWIKLPMVTHPRFQMRSRNDQLNY